MFVDISGGNLCGFSKGLSAVINVKGQDTPLLGCNAETTLDRTLRYSAPQIC